MLDAQCEHGSRWIFLPSLGYWTCVVRSSECDHPDPPPEWRGDDKKENPT